MKIFLIGFMGSGKTTLGRKTAHKLKIPFFDLDHLIEEQVGITIGEYFSSHGEESFRKLESSMLQTFPFPESCVISTGGGSPCFYDNIDWMNENGATVYLCLSPEVLASRLESGKEARPLIRNLDHDQLIKFITEKIAERDVFYNRARYIVKGMNISAGQLIDELKLN